MNILYSVVLLKDFKNDFDICILRIIKSYKKVPKEVLEPTAKLSFAAFPSLSSTEERIHIKVPNNLEHLNEETVKLFKPTKKKLELEMMASNKRKRNVKHNKIINAKLSF